MRRAVLRACGVSYASLVLTTFGLLKEPREALQDALAGSDLPPLVSEKLIELTECVYCCSFWTALVATKGRPIKALHLAGASSIITSLVLIAIGED